MCNNAIVFANTPKGTGLEAGQTYYFCMCGRSNEGLFCDGSHQGSGCEPKAFSVEKSKPYHLCRCKASKNLPFCDGSHSFFDDAAVGGTVNTNP